MSDVLAIVADIRHPLFHFPPSLYRYCVEVLHKPIILILNKVRTSLTLSPFFLTFKSLSSRFLPFQLLLQPFLISLLPYVSFPFPPCFLSQPTSSVFLVFFQLSLDIISTPLDIRLRIGSCHSLIFVFFEELNFNFFFDWKRLILLDKRELKNGRNFSRKIIQT